MNHHGNLSIQNTTLEYECATYNHPTNQNCFYMYVISHQNKDQMFFSKLQKKEWLLFLVDKLSKT